MENNEEKRDHPRFLIKEHDGPPHGGLYELEIDKYFDIIDKQTGEVVLRFEGEYSASLAAAIENLKRANGFSIKIQKLL